MAKKEKSCIAETVLNIPLDEINPSSLNRRVDENSASVASLALSMSERGLVQPIVLRAVANGYEITAGERRWRAAKKLGWETIPAIVREQTEDEAHADRLIENLQREDVPPLEQSAGVKFLMDRFSGNAAEVAAQLGVSETWVRIRAQLSNLSPSWREELSDPDTPYESLRDHVTWQEQLAKLPHSAQDALGKINSLKYCNSLESLKRVLGEQMRRLSEKPWSDEAEKILGKRYGTCKKCAHRSDRAQDLFADLLPADDVEARCLDAECWERKVFDWLRLELGKLRAEHTDAVVLIEYGLPSDYTGLASGVEVLRQWDCVEPENADDCELAANERLVWALIATGDRKGQRTRIIVTAENDAEDAPETDQERAEREQAAQAADEAQNRLQRRVDAFCERVQALCPDGLRSVADGTDAAVEVVRLAAMVYDHTLTAEQALAEPFEKLAVVLWEVVRDQLLEIANEEQYDDTGRLAELAQVIGIELPE